MPIGKGRVRFAEVFAGLHRLNYTGPITIEREIAGPAQESDIASSKLYFQRLLKQTWGT